MVKLALVSLSALFPLCHENELIGLCRIDLAKLVEREILTVFRFDLLLILDVQLENLGVEEIILQLELASGKVDMVRRLQRVLVKLLEESVALQPLFLVLNDFERVGNHLLRFFVDGLDAVFLQSQHRQIQTLQDHVRLNLELFDLGDVEESVLDEHREVVIIGLKHQQNDEQTHNRHRWVLQNGFKFVMSRLVFIVIAEMHGNKNEYHAVDQVDRKSDLDPDLQGGYQKPKEQKQENHDERQLVSSRF